MSQLIEEGYNLQFILDPNFLHILHCRLLNSSLGSSTFTKIKENGF